MARKSQRDETLVRCPCDRVAKFHVGPEKIVACTLHVANAIRNVILAGADGTVVEVTAVEGQL